MWAEIDTAVFARRRLRKLESYFAVNRQLYWRIFEIPKASRASKPEPVNPKDNLKKDRTNMESTDPRIKWVFVPSVPGRTDVHMQLAQSRASLYIEMVEWRSVNVKGPCSICFWRLSSTRAHICTTAHKALLVKVLVADRKHGSAHRGNGPPV